MNFKHGLRDSREYRIWAHMKTRCENEKCPAYKNYGGRGITVCERWQSFSSFYEDMGTSPEGTSIDRINNDGNYEPGNCRWANRSEQARNKRNSRMLKVDHVQKTAAEWAEEYGIAINTILQRISYGWTEKEAVTIPVIRSRLGLRYKKNRGAQQDVRFTAQEAA